MSLYTPKEKIFYVLIFIVLLLYSILITWKHFADKKYKSKDIVFDGNNIPNIQNKIFIKENYFTDNLKLKDYSWTKFKITEEWKKLINNMRNLHKSASLIWRENAHKEVCAWYIWILSEKIWWEWAPYHLWMINTTSRWPAAAWELPIFYKWLWWDILIDLSNKFEASKKDYWGKINEDDLQIFFKTAFLEEALFWDIWFLYRDTKYTWFLKWWSSNSHITKNVWISEFEFIVWKDYKNKKTIDIISDTLNCWDNINKKLFSVLKNYKLFLNWERVVLKDKKLFYLYTDNSLWKEVKLKYLDKISYTDIALSHYFWARSNLDWLFDMTCSWTFFPINIISINKRLIEKM